jgi:Ca2+-binding RTX toxin-like protein
MKVRTTTRRGALLLVAMLVALLTLSGVALAAFLPGTNGPDRIGGTNRADTIRGYGGNDILDGNNGPDHITGGPGDDNIADGTVHEQSTDRIWGSSGNDRQQWE